MGEVILGLAGEQSQSHEDAQSEDQGFQHNRGLEKAGDDCDAVCLEEREAAQEQEIGRV